MNGSGNLKSINIGNGNISEVPSDAATLNGDTQIYCFSADCDAIHDFETAQSGVTGGSTTWSSGMVCATDVNICVNDCRKQGFTCPLAHPSCDTSTGVCR